MSASMLAVVEAEARALPYVSALLVLGVVFLGVGYAIQELGGALALWVACSAVIGGIYWLWVRPRATQDRDGGVFVRSRGEIGLSRIDQGGDYIITPDGAELSVELDVVKAYLAMHPPRGEVDYAPRSEVLFEIRDPTGAVVWRHPGLED